MSKDKKSQVEAALGGKAEEKAPEAPASSAQPPVEAPTIELPPGYKPAGPSTMPIMGPQFYEVAVASDEALAAEFGAVQTAQGPKPARRQMAKFGIDGGFSNVLLMIQTRDPKSGQIELEEVRFNVNDSGDVSGPFFNQDTGTGQYRAGRNGAINALRRAATAAPPEYGKALEALIASAGRGGKPLVVYEQVNSRRELSFGQRERDIMAFLNVHGDFFRAEAAKIDRVVTRAERRANKVKTK